MTPVYQTRRSTPEKAGDCFESCIASMLDVKREYIPDMVGDAVEGQNIDEATLKKMHDFFGRIGMAYVEIGLPGPLPKVQTTMHKAHPGMAYVLIGRTKAQHLHAVVCRDGVVIHDPGAKRVQPEVISEPALDGFYRLGIIALTL